MVANVGAYSCYPDHLRGRAADGDGRAAGALRRARLLRARARRAHQHLPDGALSRRFAAGDHVGAGAADGQAPRPRLGIDPVEIRRRNLVVDVSLHVRDRPRVRRGQLPRRRWRSPWRRSTSPAFRARQQEARAERPLPRHRLLRRSPSAPATARRPSPRAAWRSRPATRRSRWRWTRRAIVEARIGASPHGQGLRTTLAPDHRRRARRRAGRDPRHPRRHRPHALRLGHLRQPLDGHLRRRHAARGAQGARASSSRSRATLLEATADDIVLADGEAACRRHRPRDADRELARAAYHQAHRFGERHRPGPDARAPPTIRPAPSPTPATRRSSRSTSRPARCGSSGSWWSRTPAASSTR